MNKRITLFLLVLYFSNTAAHEEYLPEIIVPGHAEQGLVHYVKVTPSETGLNAPDAARLISALPGADYNDNGPLSGQTQYRGMSGPRMNVRIDGMHINSGGPNWMDPPLHYIPLVLLDSLEMTRGIASVSKGAGIGGNIDTRYLSSHFTDGAEFRTDGQITLGGHSVDGGYDLGGIVSIANNRQRLHILGSHEQGDNRKFGDGEIADTGYRRSFIGAGYGVKINNQELSLDYRRSETGKTGNPVLPMDIAFLDTDLLQLRQAGGIGTFEIESQLSYTHVAHRMTNYQLRQPPDFSSLPLPPFVGSDRRYVNTGSRGLGYSLHASHDLGGGRITLGIDGHLDENSANLFDPDFEAFYINNYHAVQSDTYGFFAEWRSPVTDRLGVELGIRYNREEMNAGRVDAQPADLPMASMPGTPPFAVRMLRDRFNAADRSRSDNNLDWVAKVNYSLSRSTLLELGLARKTRSPGYVERYSWVPLEANSGLGDGNNYVGNVNLKPEVSHQVELGIEWQRSGAYLSPRAYYRRVDNYIQGVPATDMFVRAVSANASGDPNPLQFANVDAEIYGFDAMYGVGLGEHWRLDGSITYSRGRRRDIHDDLYRIAPLHTRLSLNYRRENWSVNLQGIAYASQNRISQVITGNSAVGSSRHTPGHVTANLYGQYAFPGTGLTLQAGIDNLLDKDYIDHLSGFNRISGSDVPVGERLRGAGRNVYATLTYKW